MKNKPSKKVKKVTAWAVIRRDKEEIWVNNPINFWAVSLAIYRNKDEADKYCEKCNENRKIYKVVSVTITYPHY